MDNIDAVKTVLAADDSAVALAMLSRSLHGAGYRVVTAADGIEAVQQAHRESPDLIILDITMPRMNGHQVCRLLKRDPATAHIPVIILTGAESRGTEFWSLRTGADAFMIKSAESGELPVIVEKLLARSSSGVGEAAGSLPASFPAAGSPPGPEAILAGVCALMDEELYATTIERIELKTIVRNLTDGVLTLNMKREVTAANRAFCRMLGKEEGDLLCRPCASALGEPLGTDVPAAFASALSGSEGVEQESEIRRLSGQTTPVAFSAMPLRDYLGMIVGVVCLFQDITRRKEIEALYERMRALDKVKDDLTNMIVHDLRTPLTSLLTGLQTLEPSENLVGVEREILDLSIAGGHKLLGMINDLLDVSKMEDGSMTLELSLVALPELVADAVQQVKWISDEKRLTVCVQFAPEISLLRADDDKLKRVMVNLLGNAVKFTPQGGAVTVTASAVPREDAIVVGVRDTGEGIPEEAFGRIFEKFGQVETRKAGKKMSTGLGLTFCKLVVEAHGGRIWVESEPGQGSTFYFTLPAAISPAI